ncbi:MAG: DNA-directed DNA polymerase eta rad30 [Icmadophila ericetorum]|nr:DNA-directed DNA polymerase eta rad30 [Icmadophila ericetorum]
MVRLNLPEDQPLAVQQWSGLIAVNYPARNFGIGRFLDLAEAKKLCPNIILQHVATWREGDERWAYHTDAFSQAATHKVSLDPYRKESRRIFACIRDVLPPPPVQRVEKASVDEMFMDLSSQVHSILLERYPELDGPAPYDDLTENLPRPPTTVIDWDTDALIDLDNTETEDDDPDWDDIVMSIGSEIIRRVRAAIRERLKYTCSAGVARNKMLAKLGAGHKKPNQQTIIRNRAIQQFLGGFKFTKIRNLGGKLGEQVVSLCGTDQVEELLKVPAEQLKLKLGDDTGFEVNPRTQIQSMLSAKSFRPSINSFEEGVRWLRIFVADIFSRLVEEGVLEHKRRPKTLNLYHRQGGQFRSRQAPIPSGKAIDEQILFTLAKNLLSQVIVDGRAWPCSCLRLSVGGFEDGPKGNQGIGGFLVRGEEAKAMRPTVMQEHSSSSIPDDSGRPPAEKRRKIDNGSIQRFFSKQESYPDEDDDDDFGLGPPPTTTAPSAAPTLGSTLSADNNYPCDPDNNADISNIHDLNDLIDDQVTQFSPPSSPPLPDPVAVETYLCPDCKASIPITESLSHSDWHFAKNLAKDLQAAERTTSSTGSSALGKGGTAERPAATGRSGSLMMMGKGKHATGKVEKGQKRLAFGR